MVDNRLTVSVQADNPNGIVWGDFWGFLDALEAKVGVAGVHVIGNTTTVREAFARYPNALIASRDPTGENEVWSGSTMPYYLQRQRDNTPDDPRIIVCVGNEANPNFQNVWDTASEGLRWWDLNGGRRSISFHHWGTGTPDDSVFSQPYVRRFMQELTNYNRKWANEGRGQCYWGSHEYWFENVWQPEFDPQKGPPPLGNTFLTGRVLRIKKQFQDAGLPVPPFIITEHGRDCGNNNYPNCDANRGYRNPKHPMSPSEFWANWVYAWKYVYAKMPEVAAVFIFVWSDGTRWNTFNYGLDSAFREYWLSHVETGTVEPPIDPPEPPMDYIDTLTILAPDGLNFRDAPGTSGKILFKLPGGFSGPCLDLETVYADGTYQWRHIEVKGYSAAWAAETVLDSGEVYFTIKQGEADPGNCDEYQQQIIDLQHQVESLDTQLATLSTSARLDFEAILRDVQVMNDRIAALAEKWGAQ